ncbi:MAG TPA: hypothetical protein VM282_27465 [Acidimicrobiales bacterium]|nr:hypothetical protein [Acidimicrobiales bacterium]
MPVALRGATVDCVTPSAAVVTGVASSSPVLPPHAANVNNDIEAIRNRPM